MLCICVGDVMDVVFSVCIVRTGQVGLGVGSWPSNRATEGSNPKGTRLYCDLTQECRKYL